MICCDDVSLTYPAPARGASPVRALDHVSLQVAAGEVVGIVGPSGSGKSTLVRLLTRLERPTSGRVVVDGHDLATLDRAGLREHRRRTSMVFQHFNLLDSRDALGNIELPLALAGVPGRERRLRAWELLERVGLGEKARSHPAQLSGGQKQRVALARALVTRPSVLLCDEATSALDPASTAQVLGLLRELTADLGLTTVLITHEMDVVRRACDRAVALAGGRVVDDAPVAEIAGRPGTPLAAALAGVAA